MTSVLPSRERLAQRLAIFIAAVWAIVIIASIVTGDSTLAAAVTPVMLIVAGFVFGFTTRRNGDG